MERHAWVWLLDAPKDSYTKEFIHKLVLRRGRAWQEVVGSLSVLPKGEYSHCQWDNGSCSIPHFLPTSPKLWDYLIVHWPKALSQKQLFLFIKWFSPVFISTEYWQTQESSAIWSYSLDKVQVLWFLTKKDSHQDLCFETVTSYHTKWICIREP